MARVRQTSRRQADWELTSTLIASCDLLPPPSDAHAIRDKLCFVQRGCLRWNLGQCEGWRIGRDSRWLNGSSLAANKARGNQNEHDPPCRGRVLWHILADLRRLRQCRSGCGISRARDRLSRCRIGVRPHRADDGLCGRPYLGRSFQSRRHHRSVGRQAVRRE